MDIVVANGFAMESCTFFSREYHCCVLHNTRCKCEDYNPRNSKPITKADRIRAMSDEELAEYLFDRGNGSEYCYGICAYQDKCKEAHAQEFCIEQIINWLKQEGE